MSGVCNYQSKDYNGRNLDNYCYQGRDGEVEEFGTNSYTASWDLSTLDQRNAAQGVNSAMRSCLDPHNNQALSVHTGGMEDVENPILTGDYDVTCDDTDILSASNQVITDSYTVNYEASLDCEDSKPVAIIKSILKFDEQPGSDPNCLQAEATRTVAMDTSTTGTSGIIKGAVEKCIGLKTELTDQLDALPPRETTYSEEDHCRFPVNQTFTPIPSPSPYPSSTPFPSPYPTSTPSSTPFPSPFPSSTPSSTPFPSPFPSSTPSSTPFPSPFPSSTPSSTPFPSPFPSSTPSSTPFPSPFPSSTPSSTPFPSPYPTSTPSSTPFPSPFPSSTPSSTPFPSPYPTSTPSSTPFPSPFPSSTPSSTPFPSPYPTSTPSSTPFPSPYPTSTPSYAPAPTPSPFSSPGDFFEEHRKMIIIVAAIAFFILVALGIYIWRKTRNPGQVYTGTGPAIARDNPDTTPPSPPRTSSPTPATPLLPQARPPLSINSGDNLFDGMEGEFFDVDFSEIVDLQKKTE
ncbi:MAG: hypothetical protein KFB93_00385 [Simkaniaceae bacterium]|nr:MAG: hypothetical protein KFB93_00385 [Simkaniaceae bacterium]